jgi:hypothetical protein
MPGAERVRRPRRRLARADATRTALSKMFDIKPFYGTLAHVTMLVRMFVRAIALAALLSVGCAPGAASSSCRNDSECPDAEHGRAYCVNHHCVECITKASCGPHRTCESGSCVPH